MHCLRIDYTKCNDCEECEVMLPKFRSIHAGYIMISDNRVKDENVVNSIEAVKKACPCQAIIFCRIDD